MSALPPSRRPSVTPSTIACAAPWPVWGRSGCAASPIETEVFCRRRHGAERFVESGRHVREDGSWIGHAGRHELAGERQEPVDAGIAGPGDQRLDTRAEVIDGGQRAEMVNHAVNGAADGDDPARTRRRLTGMQQAPDDRPGAVCANEQVSVGLLAIAEKQRHTSGTLREPLGFVIDGDVTRTDGFEERSMQCRPQGNRHSTAHGCCYRQVDPLDDGAIHPPHFAKRT